MENFSHEELVPSPSRPGKLKKTAFAIGFIVFLFLAYVFFLSSPSDFPLGAVITIEQGRSLHGISGELKKNRIIRSPVAFEAFAILYGAESHIVSGNYLFDYAEPVWRVAQRLSKGERHAAPVVITIPEGFTVAQIAEVCAGKLPAFNKNNFLREAKEGYLFPDTYYFFNMDTETEVLKSMGENFEKKIAPLRPEILLSGKTTGKTERDIIVMASVVEKEAEGDDDRELIAGILWKRISLGMPLQVDAAPDTYQTKGLPRNPISNPGLEAIKASMHPKISPYLYYLHDKDGVVHYARTFAEHKANIKKYLL